MGVGDIDKKVSLLVLFRSGGDFLKPTGSKH
jgi:hypothetical protein